MKDILYFLRLLLQILSGVRRYGRRYRISHYPGTPYFVHPSRLGAITPSDPDAWYGDDDDYSSSGYSYCRNELGQWVRETDVMKPRATRE